MKLPIKFGRYSIEDLSDEDIICGFCLARRTSILMFKGHGKMEGWTIRVWKPTVGGQIVRVLLSSRGETGRYRLVVEEDRLLRLLRIITYPENVP
ncbi:MAG TPA: hypothetical protein VGK56_11080 [Anaerolineales bacterium]